MIERLIRRAARRRERAGHRWRVGAGLAIVAVLVALGVIPARRGLTVRYHGPPRRSKPTVRRRSRRRSRLSRLLARWR